jgi:tryptophanyl-tRNA synthetase
VNDKALRKQIMSIQTDSTPLEEPKNPDTCHVFALYKILANETEVAQMRQQYQAGGFGYGHAKQALFECIVHRFGDIRERYQYYLSHPEEVEQALALGAQKARKVAQGVLQRVRTKVGFTTV